MTKSCRDNCCLDENRRQQIYAQRWLKQLDDRGIVEKRLLFPTISRYLGKQVGKRCFDAGCGNGWSTSLLVNAGAMDIVAGDNNPFLLQNTASDLLEKVHFKLIDITDPLPFDESSIDTILCKGVFMGISDGDVEKALSEFSKVIAVGGQLIVMIVHPLWHLFVADIEPVDSFHSALSRYLKNERISINSISGVTDYFRYRRPLGWYSRQLHNHGFVHEVEEIAISHFNGISERYSERIGFPVFAVFSCSYYPRVE